MAWLRGTPASAAASSQSTYYVARWAFLRGLGVVYLCAFGSLWAQVLGLVGSRGILPVADFIDAVSRALGPERYGLLPTLLWFDASDAALSALCAAGVALSCALVVGIAPVLVLTALWAVYLSLSVAGQDFLSYQWDALLLESGFLAIFLAPVQLIPRPSREAPPSAVIVWLFRWLLFRLMFGSGVVKLASGDQTWRGLEALRYHYETQPLPSATSWWVHQLPASFQALSTLLALAAELVLPVLAFGPRRARVVSCVGLVGLQALIAGTGNYGFFNLLSALLCLLVLDDGCFPARWRGCFGTRADPSPAWPAAVTVPVGAVIFVLTAMPLWDQYGPVHSGPRGRSLPREVVSALRSFNTYGLFAVMTTERPEIVVEGSDDGRDWQPYEFRWKPGDLCRAPAFAGPHMPRLDWQMWFAALGSPRGERWFPNFLARLLEGSPDVLSLLGRNPFPDRPPHLVRAELYRYRFTDRAERQRTGAWWRREYVGPYFPAISLAGAR